MIKRSAFALIFALSLALPWLNKPARAGGLQTIETSNFYSNAVLTSSATFLPNNSSTLTFTGIGYDYNIQIQGVAGSSATFYWGVTVSTLTPYSPFTLTLSTITVWQGAPLNGLFRFFGRNPTAYFTNLSPGSTVQALIEGGNLVGGP